MAKLCMDIGRTAGIAILKGTDIIYTRITVKTTGLKGIEQFAKGIIAILKEFDIDSVAYEEFPFVKFPRASSVLNSLLGSLQTLCVLDGICDEDFKSINLNKLKSRMRKKDGTPIKSKLDIVDAINRECNLTLKTSEHDVADAINIALYSAGKTKTNIMSYEQYSKNRIQI